VEIMPERRNVKNVFKNIPEGKWPIRKPGKTWLDNFKNYFYKWVFEARKK
jgi:hypothetical protein